jgi:hypothetical protein
MCAQAGLVALVWLRLYAVRLTEIRTRRIDPQQLARADEAVKLLANNSAADNLRNLFEIPVLFFAICLALYVTGFVTPLQEIATASDVPRRKARIVLELLKRHGAMREYRGGSWERIAGDVTTVDVGHDILDYEDRRLKDREKLEAMVAYCRTARCRTKRIMDYFGVDTTSDYECGHCDNCVDAGIAARAVPA